MNSLDSIGNARLIVREVEKAIVGKDDVIIKVLLALIARGHILMEDIPGVGKTTLAVSLSKALGLQYNRVQFTPDVLPSDITGYSIYDKESGQMRYQKGAVLCNLFLADELNRATSRTQSALLQAMEEGEVTVDGKTYPVPQPFVVIATQNPTGAKGTQMLPDSQMDRFMLRLSLGYPSHEDEMEIIRRRQSGIPLETVSQVVDREKLMEIRRQADQVYIKESVIDYIVSLCARRPGTTPESFRAQAPGRPWRSQPLPRPPPGFRDGIMFWPGIFVSYITTASRTVCSGLRSYPMMRPRTPYWKNCFRL